VLVTTNAWKALAELGKDKWPNDGPGRLRYLQMKSLWGNFQPSLEIEYNIDFLMNYTLRVPLILTLNLN
jgi:hypothetical protein